MYNKKIKNKMRANLTSQIVIERAKKIHGDKYDYSKVNYINAKTKIYIICNGCGYEFPQIPHSHLSGAGCPNCKGGVNITTDEFIIRGKKIHGDLYDYSKVSYVNSTTEVCIICKECGEIFWQRPIDHLSGNKCNVCSRKRTSETRIKNNRITFEQKANVIHKNKYDYSKVNYVGAKTKVCIVCKKCGYEFPQTPNDHLNGYGCPKCVISKLEITVSSIFDNYNIQFEYRYKGFDWLKNKLNLELDFYLPEHNIAIECQGEQHFRAVEYWGGEKTYQKIRERDKIKKRLCEEHNLPLYYINYNDNVEEKLNDILSSI